MDSLALAFFPLPHVLDGERYKGYRFSWPDRCNRCDRQCERSSARTIAECSYGVNYIWLDSKLLVFGFLVRGRALSSAQKKMIRNNPDHLVTPSEIESAAQVYGAAINAFNVDIEARKKAVLADYAENRRYEQEFLEALRPEIGACQQE